MLIKPNNQVRKLSRKSVTVTRKKSVITMGTIPEKCKGSGGIAQVRTKGKKQGNGKGAEILLSNYMVLWVIMHFQT